MQRDPGVYRTHLCIRAVALGAVLLVCAPADVRSQADTTRVTVTGTVVDGATRRPLEGVAVAVREIGLIWEPV
jgi:hypothetical protein